MLPLTILVFCAIAQATSGFEIPERYFKMPLWEGLMTSERTFDDNRVKDLELEPGSSPEMVRDQLKKYSERFGSVYGVRTARNLVTLADDWSDCSSDTVYVFLATYQVYKVTKQAKNPESMLDFLEYYGRKHFQNCAPKAIDVIKQETEKLDEHFMKAKNFFKLALSLGTSDVSEVDFYNKLKQFEPLKSSFDIDKLAPISERKTKLESTAQRVKKKFDSMCIIVSFVRSELNILNLANSLAPEMKYFEREPSLGALSEINRICNEAYQNVALQYHLEKFCKPKHDSMYPLGPILKSIPAISQMLKALQSKVKSRH